MGISDRYGRGWLTDVSRDSKKAIQQLGDQAAAGDIGAAAQLVALHSSLTMGMQPGALESAIFSGGLPPAVLVSQQAFGTDRGYARRSIDREYRRFSDDQRAVDAAISAYNSGNAGPLFALGLSRNPDLARQAGGALGLTFAPDGGFGASVNAFRTPADLQNLGLSPNALTAANLVYGYGPQGYNGALANAISGIYAPGPINPFGFSPQLNRYYDINGYDRYAQGYYLPGFIRTPPGGPPIPGPFKATMKMEGTIDTRDILNNPSLTVEDQVTLMIMLIMKKMDDDIKKEAKRINDLQQQQADWKDENPNKGDMPDSESIDIATLNLKRMVDKRSQMFDLLRQIIDKYNQTAKGIIDTMGR